MPLVAFAVNRKFGMGSWAGASIPTGACVDAGVARSWVLCGMVGAWSSGSSDPPRTPGDGPLELAGVLADDEG